MPVQNILLCLAVVGSTPLTFAAPLVIPNREIVSRDALPAVLPIETHILKEERDVQTKRRDDKDKGGNGYDDDDKNKGNGGKYGGGYGGKGGKHYKREGNSKVAEDTASLVAENGSSVDTKEKWLGGKGGHGDHGDHGGEGAGRGVWGLPGSGGKHWRRDDDSDEDELKEAGAKWYGGHGGGHGDSAHDGKGGKEERGPPLLTQNLPEATWREKGRWGHCVMFAFVDHEFDAAATLAYWKVSVLS
ncbi:hypothetical protein BDZ45DRAFT_724820 [Acephala macrosclerotiorum]|nr:hypothetical protein BDZ45DRAFT_724820 [Acephala macrosclerotiorum]